MIKKTYFNIFYKNVDFILNWKKIAARERQRQHVGVCEGGMVTVCVRANKVNKNEINKLKI